MNRRDLATNMIRVGGSVWPAVALFALLTDDPHDQWWLVGGTLAGAAVAALMLFLARPSTRQENPTMSDPDAPKPPRLHRHIWWVELFNAVLFIGAIIGVYQLAGGDGTDLTRPLVEQFEQPSRPVIAVVALLVVLGLMTNLCDYGARRTTVRNMNAMNEHKRALKAAALAKKAASVGGIRGEAGVEIEVGVPEQRQYGPKSVNELVESLVRLYGPCTFAQLHDWLCEGGQWGPPFLISESALRRLLTAGPGRVPPVWLAKIPDSELYDHVDNVRMREPH